MRGLSEEHIDFEVFEPAAHIIPFVFNSPHSGRHYSRDFMAQSRLDGLTIRKSEDVYTWMSCLHLPSRSARRC